MQDLKANESRLKDINKVANDLESEGLMAEEVQAVQQQVCVCLWLGPLPFYNKRQKELVLSFLLLFFHLSSTFAAEDFYCFYFATYSFF